MNTIKGMTLAHVVVAAALTACTGCASALPAGQPAAVESPTVAFAASEDDLATPCSIEGTPRVVATHVSPMAGVTAEADGSRVWLRFATRNNPRAAVSLDPTSLDVEDEEGAAPSDSTGVLRGASPKSVPNGSVAVGVQGGRRLVAWTAGSTYDGLRVHAVTLAENGSPVGAPIELGFEGSAIGRPAVAVNASGRGVLAFEESYGAGFHLVAARVVCSAPAVR